MDKTYLYAKDPYEAKYQLLINKLEKWRENTRLKSTQLQQNASNHSSDNDFQDFMNIYKKCTGKSYSFLVIDTTLALDNPLLFRMNFLERI